MRSVGTHNRICLKLRLGPKCTTENCTVQHSAAVKPTRVCPVCPRKVDQEDGAACSVVPHTAVLCCAVLCYAFLQVLMSR
jgi:hypothetical protein